MLSHESVQGLLFAVDSDHFYACIGSQRGTRRIYGCQHICLPGSEHMDLTYIGYAKAGPKYQFQIPTSIHRPLAQWQVFRPTAGQSWAFFSVSLSVSLGSSSLVFSSTRDKRLDGGRRSIEGANVWPFRNRWRKMMFRAWRAAAIMFRRSKVKPMRTY